MNAPIDPAALRRAAAFELHTAALRLEIARLHCQWALEELVAGRLNAATALETLEQAIESIREAA